MPTLFGDPTDTELSTARVTSFGDPIDAPKTTSFGDPIEPVSGVLNKNTTDSQPLASKQEGNFFSDSPSALTEAWNALQHSIGPTIGQATQKYFTEPLGRDIAAVMNLLDPSRQGVIPRLIGKARGIPMDTDQVFRIGPDIKELKEETVPRPYRFQAGTPTVQGPFINTDPVNRFLNRMVEGGSTPENIPFAVAGGVAGLTKAALPSLAEQLTAAYFTPQMVQGTFEGAQRTADTNLPVSDRVDAGIDTLASALFSGGAAHLVGKGEAYVPQGIKPTEYSINALGDIPIKTPERPMPVQEQNQFANVQKRESYVPTVVGRQPPIVGQNIINPYQGQPAAEALQKAYQAAGEAKQGGQISFEGQGIPNAGQSAQMPAEPLTGPDIGNELGQTQKQWPETQFTKPMQSFTDPKTGVSIEGVNPNASLEEVALRIKNKLQQNQDLERAAQNERSNENVSQSNEEEGQTGQGEIQPTAGEDLRSGDIQRESTAEEPDSVSELQPGNARGNVRSTKYYSNPAFDPEFWKEQGHNMVEIGQKVAEKAKDFKSWSNEMIDQLGEGSRPYLDNVYAASTAARQEGDFALSGPRVLVDPKEGGFRDPNKEVDAQQLRNRVKNKVHPSEWEMYKDALPESGKISPVEAAKRMQESAPKVEVKKFGKQATPESAIAQRKAQLEHEMDTLFPEWNHTEVQELPESVYDKWYEWNELEQGVHHYPETQGTTAHWSSIAPKSESDMPGYTEGAVVLPLDVHGSSLSPRPRFESSHSFPPNTLAFWRGYMEHMADGKKVFHVIEAQTDVVQEIRTGVYGVSGHPELGEFKSKKDALYASRQIHPLTTHYERLALKSAIEHAKVEGADAIAISDAETAMMTEGHDRRTAAQGLNFDEYRNLDLIDRPIEITRTEWERKQKEIPQEKGMRLHYDQTLPKIAEELTGKKGEKVEFGEHRMAMEGDQVFADNEDGSAFDSSKTRKDLIFRNPDGSPKTSVSARLYPIDKSTIKPSLLESDKPVTKSTRLYTNPLGDPDLWKSMGKDIGEVVKEGKKRFQNWVDKAASEPRPLGWSPYWQATKEERAKALLGNGPHRTLEQEQVGQGRQPGEPKPTLQPLKEAVAHIKNAINTADKSIMVKDALVDWLDNSKGKFNGTLAQHIVWPMDDNFQVELGLRDKYLKPLATVMKDEKLDQLNGERIGVALIDGQTGGRQRLLDSGVTQSSISNILSSLSEGERRAINVINKAHSDMFPSIQKVAKVFGVNVNKVDNYLSWQRDYKKFDAPPKELALPEANKSATVDDVTKWIADSYPGRGTKTASGFTIERQKGAKTPIKVNAFEVFDRHIRDAAHFVAMAEHLKDVGEIVRNDKFAAKYGKQGQDMMLDWLNTVARQGRSVNSIPWLDAMRKRAGVSMLAYRVASQVIHTVNIPFGLFRAGPEYWTRGMQASLKSYMDKDGPEATWIRNNMGETVERGGGEPGITELDTSDLSPKTAFKKVKEGAVKGGFAVQRFIDQRVAQATAVGVYQKLLAEKGKDSTKWATMPVDREALAQARVLSRRAVASPLYKDTPHVLNQGSVSKLFFQFENTFLDQWSNIRHDLPEYAKNDPKKAAGLTVAVLTMWAMESIIKLGIKSSLQKSVGYTPKQDQEGVAQKMAEEAFKRVPGGGQLMTALAYGGTGIPTIDLVLNAIKSGKQAYTAMQNEDTKSTKLAGAQTATSIAEMFGVPGASQAGEMVQNKMKAEMFKSHEQRVGEVEEKLYGKKASYSTTERVAAEREYDKTKPKMTRGEETASGTSALKANQQRGQTVQEGLDSNSQAWLKSNDLRLPGHGDKVKVRGVALTMSKDELGQFEQFLGQEYSKRIKMLQNPGFMSLPASGKKSVFDAQTKAAMEVARARMAGQINQR